MVWEACVGTDRRIKCPEFTEWLIRRVSESLYLSRSYASYWCGSKTWFGFLEIYPEKPSGKARKILGRNFYREAMEYMEAMHMHPGSRLGILVRDDGCVTIYHRNDIRVLSSALPTDNNAAEIKGLLEREKAAQSASAAS